MFSLWNKARRSRNRKKKEKDAIEVLNPNFIIRARLPPEFTTRGKQLFRKQVPKVTLNGSGSALGVDSYAAGGPIKINLLTLEKKIKNPKNCPLCKQNLTTWFSQCVSCASCNLRTCRSCADYNLVLGDWTCQKCVYRRNNKGAGAEDSVCRTSSKYWYDDILPRKESLAQYSVSLDTHVDRTSLARYEQLEQFVSRHLNITPELLNTTDVGKAYQGRAYDLLFSRYHAVISLELSELLSYLKSADQVKEAVSLRKLKELMDKVKGAAKLDLSTAMEATPVRNKGSGIKSYAPTYPDILSTAILNRIIIDGQAKSPHCSISPVSNDSAVVPDYSSTSTELPESGSEKDTHNWVLSSSTEGALVLRTSDEESIVDTPGGGNSGSDWSTENAATLQPQIKILEESIEEITTTTYESEGSSEDDGTISSHSDDSERQFDGPQSPRSAIHQNVANWEHNWLFKRRKHLLRKRQKLLEDSVTMLVPNPTEDVEVMIGDEKASDMEDDIDSLDVTELGYVVVDSDEVDRISDHEAPAKPESGIGEAKVLAKVEHPSVVDKTPVPAPRVLAPTVDPSPPEVQKVESPIVTVSVEIPIPLTPKEPETPEIHPHIQETFELEESVYETNHALLCNEKILLPTEIPKSKAESGPDSSSSESESEEPPPLPPPMRIAEREKEKWNHPVSVKYNPYAVENLNKRLKEKEFLSFPSAKSRQDPELLVEVEKTDHFPVEKRSLDKFRRDYYVQSSSSAEDRKHSTSSSSEDGEFSKVTFDAVTKIQVPISQPSRLASPSPKPVPSPRRAEVVSPRIPDSGADLEEIKLPSVRNLAKKFSSPIPEEKPLPREVMTPKTNIWKPIVVTGASPGVKQQIHSLTARSVSREFREGLRLSKPAITNCNIKITDNNF